MFLYIQAHVNVGTDEETIIIILANRSSSQRQEITQQYKLIAGSDLITDLRGDLHGNFEDTALALMMPPAVYDANQLYKAMKVGAAGRLGRFPNTCVMP